MRVLVAGGGVAGLEVVLALRHMAGDLVDVELVSAEPVFWYRPISVVEAFDPARAYRFEHGRDVTVDQTGRGRAESGKLVVERGERIGALHIP